MVKGKGPSWRPCENQDMIVTDSRNLFRHPKRGWEFRNNALVHPPQPRFVSAILCLSVFTLLLLSPSLSTVLFSFLFQVKFERQSSCQECVKLAII